MSDKIEDDEITSADCPGYYEHNYKKVNEADGIATYICRRCGAELQEETPLG